MNNNRFISAWIVCLSVFFASASDALTVKTGNKHGKVSTGDIIDSAIECTDCLDYELIGICFWLKCSLFSCSVKESLRVRHFLPDVVISSYTYQSEWDETQNLNHNPSGALAQTESMADQGTSLDFKSVDVITHPALLLFNSLPSDYFCQSMLKTPMIPHFLSSHDAAWREPGIEQLLPQSVLGVPRFQTGTGSWMGLLEGSWAPLYPRCGWGAHPLDPVNAAVAAHRAAEIVTRTVQPHTYVPLSGRCDNRCWKPGPVNVNDGTENRFQMIAPWVEHSTRVLNGPADWANGKHRIRESYLWTLWRRYSCCEKKGQVFLFKIDL
jgi:integrating conjugative element protein (TIGR03756 family)